jgi:hypothetical protein
MAVMIFGLSAASLKAQTNKTWIGGATGSWNTANAWSPNGVPNNTFHAVITDAVVTVDINTAACINLTLNGTAQINFAGANDVLSVFGDFTNNAGGTPVIGTGLLSFNGSTDNDIAGNAMSLNRVRINKTSAGSTCQTAVRITQSLTLNNTSTMHPNTNLTMGASYNSGTGDWQTSFIQHNGTGDVSAKVIIEQAIAENYKCYHMMGMPVTEDYTYTAFHEDYTAQTDVYNANYCYDEVSSIPDWMIYNEDDFGPNYPSATCSMYGYCGIDNTTALAATQGYLGNFEPDANQIIAWYGIPNTGTINSIHLQYHNHSQPDLDGLNLLGNPYPQPLDLQQLWDDNNTVSGFSPIFTIYQNTGAGYGTQALFFDASGLSSSTLPSQFIGIGQGFLVQTTVNDAVIEFNNGQRAPLNNVEYLRKQPLANQIQLRLSGLNNPDDFSISLNEIFNNKHQVGEDVFKINNEKNNFYADYGHNRLAVDKLNFPETEHIVPLSIEIKETGDYSINASLFTIDATEYICWFEDKQNRTYTEIDRNFAVNYTFNKGTISNRFFIHVANRNQIGNASVENTGCYAYFQNDNIHLNLPKDFENSQIRVNNLSGLQVIEDTRTNGNATVQIPTQNLSAGIYFISANNGTKELQTKLIINK